MLRICNVVEGPSEEKFTKEVLYPHLLHLGIYIFPILIQGNRGGHCGNYDHIWRDIIGMIKQESTLQVTTMLDLYGLPKNFPAPTGPLPADPHERVITFEEEFRKDIFSRVGDDRARRFLPNLLLHEYEGLLFSSPDTMQQVLIKADIIAQLRLLRGQSHCPECINDGRETAPSKRIKALYPSYNKPNDGVLIAVMTGLDVIRASCSHFDRWIRRLEALAPTVGPASAEPAD